MPAVYAHYSFGRDVFRTLPEPVRRAVGPHINYFLTGLQGPDILFFYKFYTKDPVNQRGYQMHRETCAQFVEAGRAAMQEAGLGRDSAQAAYLYGFLCHFMLDSSCHPYVSEMMEKLDRHHIFIESEFEKYMMRRDGREPLSFPLGQLVRRHSVPGGDIALFYPGIAPADITSAQSQMALVKDAVTCPPDAVGNTKRGAFFAILKAAGLYDEYSDQFLMPEDDPVCHESSEGLHERLRGAVIQTAGLITWMFEHIEDDAPLPERMARDFE